jgi:flagellar protein FlaG
VEVNSSVKMQSPESAVQAANVAAPAEAKTAVVLPPIEIQAPPKVKDFETKDIQQAVEDLRNFVQGLDRDLSFRIDESIDRSIITVRDANTNQLVRQIPAEEIVEIAREIRQDLDAKRAGMLLRGEA